MTKVEVFTNCDENLLYLVSLNLTLIIHMAWGQEPIECDVHNSPRK
jgi:hypothetical protein